MSFARVQARELDALAFFENKLSLTTDSSKRKQLEKMVRKLREDVQKAKEIPPEVAISNTPV